MLCWRKDKVISIIKCHENTIVHLASIRPEYISMKTIIYRVNIIVFIAYFHAPGRE